MEQRRARGMLAAAAVIFGTLAPFVRGISVSSGELALYRAVMAALLVGGYLLVSGQKITLRANRREAALLLLSGMAMGEFYRDLQARFGSCFSRPTATPPCPSRR